MELPILLQSAVPPIILFIWATYIFVSRTLFNLCGVPLHSKQGICIQIVIVTLTANIYLSTSVKSVSFNYATSGSQPDSAVDPNYL